LSTTNNKGWRTINFDLPDELRRHGIYRIAKEGNGKTWMCSVRCSDKTTDPPKDTLTVFGIGSSWEKTLKNFDKQMDGKLDTMTKEMVRFFILDNASKLQYDTNIPPTEEESKASEEAEEQVKAVSIEEAMRTESGLRIIEGTIVTMSELYQLVKVARWICNSCNNTTEVPIRNILQPPTIKSACESCGCRDFKDRHTYINTVELVVQPDEVPENPLDGLTVYVFDKYTEGIIIGEKVKIMGRIEHVQDLRSKKHHTVITAQEVKYEDRKKLVLTPEDIEECKKFVAQEDFKQKLVSMFAPNIIGEENKKLGVLLSAISSPETKKHKGRINVLLIGPPGLAKTKMGQESIELRRNSKYVSGKNTTGGSLTSMILNENGKLTMHFGPAVLARGGICFVNEFDKLDASHQNSLLEVMEEGTVHMNKFAKNVEIPAPTTIIASANPRNDNWLFPNKITREEIPFSSLIINRFDIVLAFRNIVGEEAIREFVDRKTEYDESHMQDECDYTFMEKFIEYGRTITPTLTQQARAYLGEFYVKLTRTDNNFIFNTRTLESIIRISKAFARLRLSDTVNQEIAQLTIDFLNQMFAEFHLSIFMTENPWNIAYYEVMKIIQHRKEPIELIEAVKTACDRSDQAKYYITHNISAEKVWLQKHNAKLRSICSAILENVVEIERVGENPTVVIWRKKEQVLGDTGDVGDRQKDTPQKDNKKNNDEDLKDLQELEENKSLRGKGVSKQPSPKSPISPRIELVHGSEVSDNAGAVRVSVTEVNFSYGDFQCPSCPQQFPTETNRQMHIDSAHSSRRHEAYRSGANWYCKNCKDKGDKFHMQETTCSGIKKK
jgi:replicative DNA helicase Mcm